MTSANCELQSVSLAFARHAISGLVCVLQHLFIWARGCDGSVYFYPAARRFPVDRVAHISRWEWTQNASNPIFLHLKRYIELYSLHSTGSALGLLLPQCSYPTVWRRAVVPT